jgi:hypothetical protein
MPRFAHAPGRAREKIASIGRRTNHRGIPELKEHTEEKFFILLR